MKINIEFDVEYLKKMISDLEEANFDLDMEGIGPELQPYIDKLKHELENKT